MLNLRVRIEDDFTGVVIDQPDWQLSELSPDCGQSGRVRRVFWRQGAPWVLICLSRGQLISIPWEWTSLPVPLNGDQTADHNRRSRLHPG